jgi:hypothetical protein
MARLPCLAALICIPASLLAAGPGENFLGPAMPGGYGLSGMPGMYGPAVGLGSPGDPCDRGTIFNALKVVRAYRDNEAFAFKHFEGKTLDISGRLVAVKRDKIIVNEVLVFDGFVALITPDGKAPKPIGLEFRFPVAKLQANPQLACDVAALWAGQYLTLRGTCQGPVTEGAYVGVIFNDAQIVR